VGLIGLNSGSITPMLSTILAAHLLMLTPMEDTLVKKDLTVGKGRLVEKGDLVTVLYKGWLKDGGKVFDENLKKEPFVFKAGAGQVIPGWDQGVVGMHVGGKRNLIIPAKLAYGDQGAGGDIPPKATIVFDVEVLRVDKPADKPALEIKEVKAGTGAAAKAGDNVEMHYTGMFLNGHKFDSSKDRNKTFSFQLGAKRVIDGFEKTVTGMKVGGTRTVTIPYQMAYGESGKGPIPPYSTLVFEIELISINKK